MSDISYQGIDEADLVLALYHGTRPLGFGHMHDNPKLTLQDVKEHLAEKDEKGWGRGQGEYSFDYFYGRPLKVTLDTERKIIKRADLYDRDAGIGVAQLIVNNLRQEG